MASADAGTRDTQDDSRTMRERMEAGELYVADGPELGEMSARALDLEKLAPQSQARAGTSGRPPSPSASVTTSGSGVA